MVRHGIRGAVIALVCGSAVATSMGVLSRTPEVGRWVRRADDVSQRMRYQIDQDSTGLIPVVRGLPSTGIGVGVIDAGLPEFMTRDTSSPAGASAGAIAAAQSIHTFGGSSMRDAAALVRSDFSAAVRSGTAGGFAYAYTNRFDQEQAGLGVDLAQAQAPVSGKTYGSNAPFSGNGNTPRGGADLASTLDPFSGPETVDSLPQTTPGATNSSANPTVAGGPASPSKPVIPNGVPVDGGRLWNADSDGPSDASSVPVPTPGTVGLAALAGLAAMRRRR